MGLLNLTSISATNFEEDDFDYRVQAAINSPKTPRCQHCFSQHLKGHGTKTQLFTKPFKIKDVTPKPFQG